MRILTGLMALVALAGVASAQNDPCPECDPDGPDNPENTYSSLDLGVLGNDTEALADSDWAVSHSDDEKGFWSWLSLCLGVFIAHVEDVLGVEVDVDGNVEAYVSQDGVDLDATVQMDDAVCQNVDGNVTATLGDDGGCAFGFDRSAAGDLDGQTWETLGEANAELRANGVEPHVVGFPGEYAPSVDEDVCLHAEMELGLCG